MEAVDQALGEAAEKMAEQLPILGLVGAVSGRQMTLNLGAAQGVNSGGKFLLFRPGESIRDPVSGQVLGSSKQIIGLMEIESVEVKMATGRLSALKDPQVFPQVGDVAISK